MNLMKSKIEDVQNGNNLLKSCSKKICTRSSLNIDKQNYLSFLIFAPALKLFLDNRSGMKNGSKF